MFFAFAELRTSIYMRG